MDLASLLSNRWLVVSLFLPIGPAIVLAATGGRPEANLAALALSTSVVLLALASGAWRQMKMKPEYKRKVWMKRAGLVFVTNFVTIAVSGLVLSLVWAPWRASYDNSEIQLFMLGFALSGSLAGVALCGVFTLQKRHGDGPFRSMTPNGPFVSLVFTLVFFGPIAGWGSGLLLMFLWTEGLMKAHPAGISREAWATAWGVFGWVVSALIAMGFGALDRATKAKNKAIIAGTWKPRR